MIRIYYVDDAKEYELPISGTSGAIYRCYDNDWENTRHLDIDDNTVYSEVKDLRRIVLTRRRGIYHKALFLDQIREVMDGIVQIRMM